jgi:membrane protein YqaA with SNARE-associated domain
MGFIYFIAAIPTAAGFGAPLWAGAIAAWFGYSCGGLVIALLGEPLRERLIRRFAKRLEAQKQGRLHQLVQKYGLPALGLLAPITIGPQLGALAALAVGMPKWRIVIALSLGVIPWCIGIASLMALGFKLVGPK